MKFKAKQLGHEEPLGHKDLGVCYVSRWTIGTREFITAMPYSSNVTTEERRKFEQLELRKFGIFTDLEEA